MSVCDWLTVDGPTGVYPLPDKATAIHVGDLSTPGYPVRTYAARSEDGLREQLRAAADGARCVYVGHPRRRTVPRRSRFLRWLGRWLPWFGPRAQWYVYAAIVPSVGCEKDGNTA